MDYSIWRNPEIKRLILVFLAVMLVLASLMMVYTGTLWTEMNKEIISKDIAIIGKLVEGHPELRDEIVPAFTGKADEGEIKKGIQAAGRYGYDTGLPITVNPVFSRFYGRIALGVVLFSLAFFIILVFAAFITMRGIYKRMRKIADAASRIVDGNFNILLDEEKEGDFAKLGYQFSQMSKRLQLTLEQLKNEKFFLKNIISDISHQLKTPLSSLKVFNELLLEGNPADEGLRREFLEKSGVQVERMEWLIRNLLLVARIEAGAMEFRKSCQPLLPTVEEAVESLRFKWESRGLKLNLTGRNEEICLKHDRKWLAEALGNIIKNGIEHSPDGGNIDIELSETAVMVRAVVTDHGEGIHSEDLPHVFKRFYSGRNNLRGSGTGIGLTLAKSIIEGQGGMIGVKSTPGKGTEFTITFPKWIA